MIIQFPSSRALAIRVERERDGDGWLTLTHNREFGWLHGDFNAAIANAHVLARHLGVSVRLSAGALPC